VYFFGFLLANGVIVFFADLRIAPERIRIKIKLHKTSYLHHSENRQHFILPTDSPFSIDRPRKPVQPTPELKKIEIPPISTFQFDRKAFTCGYLE